MRCIYCCDSPMMYVLNSSSLRARDLSEELNTASKVRAGFPAVAGQRSESLRSCHGIELGIGGLTFVFILPPIRYNHGHVPIICTGCIPISSKYLLNGEVDPIWRRRDIWIPCNVNEYFETFRDGYGVTSREWFSENEFIWLRPRG